VVIIIIIIIIDCETRRYIQGFGRGSLTKRDHFEQTKVEGGVILKWIFKMWDGGNDCIHQTQNTDRWRAHVMR